MMQHVCCTMALDSVAGKSRLYVGHSVVCVFVSPSTSMCGAKYFLQWEANQASKSSCNNCANCASMLANWLRLENVLQATDARLHKHGRGDGYARAEFETWQVSCLQGSRSVRVPSQSIVWATRQLQHGRQWPIVSRWRSCRRPSAKKCTAHPDLILYAGYGCDAQQQINFWSQLWHEEANVW